MFLNLLSYCIYKTKGDIGGFIIPPINPLPVWENKVTKSYQQLRRGELWKMNRQLVMGRVNYFLAQNGLWAIYFLAWATRYHKNSGDPFLFWFWATAWYIPIYNPLMLVCCCYLVSSSAGGCQPWYFENSNLPSSLFLHCISHAIAAAYIHIWIISTLSYNLTTWGHFYTDLTDIQHNWNIL